MRLAPWLLLAAASAAPAQAPQLSGPTFETPHVSATASKAELTIGEPFTVEVVAEGPAGATFSFSGELASEELELRTAPPGPGAPPVAGRHRYEAMAFTLGETSVPPIPVKYRLLDGTEGETATAPVPLRVVSLLPKDPEQQKLADIRGPVPLAIGRAFWIALAVAVASVGALGIWLWRRRRRASAAAAPVVPEVPPDVEALAALEALAASRLAERGDFRGFYIRLTTIGKRYLERRLGAPVLEMTSAETTAFLREGPHADLMPVVRDLAGAADQVKFARGEGLAQEAERHLQAVRELVHRLEYRLRPPAPERAA